MMQNSRQGMVYRIEEIDRASRNLNFKAAGLPMHNNQKYDLFKFKGGVNCGHIWKEVLYKLKANKDKDSKDIEDYKKKGLFLNLINQNQEEINKQKKHQRIWLITDTTLITDKIWQQHYL